MAERSGAPLNYTTTIKVDTTLGEVQRILARAGCSAVATNYDGGRAVGLSFTLRTPHGERAFSLPVNLDGVLKLLQDSPQVAKARKSGRHYDTPDHAERVAWRVVKDWLEAQLALIDASMATLDQVMLPYLRVTPELTMWEAYREHEAGALRALEA